MFDEIFAQCRKALPGWRDLTPDDVEHDAPKGFSSYTVTIRAKAPVDPPAIFYRRLEGKENAILPRDLERRVFLLLGDAGIAARCPYYGPEFRLEACYTGRTLTPADLRDPETLRGIATQLRRFHALDPDGLPEDGFFTLLHRQWGALARRVLTEEIDRFPEAERHLGPDLLEITSEETHAKVLRMLPDSPLGFSHNDTYHGNVFLLDGPEPVADRVRLLDFEFACRNHRAFDFSNLFAETVMRHGLAEYPHFDIADPEFAAADIRRLVEAYVGSDDVTSAERTETVERLVAETLDLIPMSHFMYAMAAIPLAAEPIQKIRFLPYARRRFDAFLAEYRQRFGDA